MARFAGRAESALCIRWNGSFLEGLRSHRQQERQCHRRWLRCRIGRSQPVWQRRPRGNGMVGGADGSGGRSWRTVETRSMLSAFDTTFRTPTFWASTSTCKEQCLVCISMGISGRSLEIARAGASPSMTGMTRSRMMGSGSWPGLWLQHPAHFRRR